MWVIQRREGLRFAVQPGEPFDVASERVREHLNRDVAIQPRVPRAKHLAHSAGANRGDDDVRAELRAWSEGHS